MKSYWTAVGLFNKGSFTKALEKLTAIPETDPLSLYGFQLKAQLARQLQDRQLLLETLSRLGQAESPPFPPRAPSSDGCTGESEMLPERRRYSLNNSKRKRKTGRTATGSYVHTPSS